MHSTEIPTGRELQISGVGEPMVLLHGWAMNSAVWLPVQQKLESVWEIHRINLPGHGGLANAKTNATFDDWLEDVMAVAPAEAVWLGWSLGGLFALAAAARYPERVKRLILVATTPKFIFDKDWQAAGDQTAWNRFTDQLVDAPDTCNDQFLKTQAIGSKKPMQLSKQLKKFQIDGGEADKEALLAGLQMLQATDLRAELSRISCPVQWILGEGDQLIPVRVAEDILSLNPACDISIVPRAGHAPFISQPDHFMQIVNKL